MVADFDVGKSHKADEVEQMVFRGIAVKLVTFKLREYLRMLGKDVRKYC